MTKAEQKREAILEAAQTIFRSEGYIRANMDTIAKAANVTKQTVYRYFNSKEALFQAALKARREKFPSRCLEELKRKDTREALIHFAIGFIETHLSEDHLAMVRLLISEGRMAPELSRSFFADEPRQTEEQLRQFLKERFHLENADYEAKFLFSALLSMRMSVLVGMHERPSPEQIATHAEKTINFVIKALA